MRAHAWHAQKVTVENTRMARTKATCRKAHIPNAPPPTLLTGNAPPAAHPPVPHAVDSFGAWTGGGQSSSHDSSGGSEYTPNDTDEESEGGNCSFFSDSESEPEPPNQRLKKRGGKGVAKGGKGFAKGGKGLAKGGKGITKKGKDLSKGGKGLARGGKGLARGGKGLARGGKGPAKADKGPVKVDKGPAKAGKGVATRGRQVADSESDGGSYSEGEAVWDPSEVAGARGRKKVLSSTTKNKLSVIHAIPVCIFPFGKPRGMPASEMEKLVRENYGEDFDLNA